VFLAGSRPTLPLSSRSTDGALGGAAGGSAGGWEAVDGDAVVVSKVAGMNAPCPGIPAGSATT
jgi:hypothetical protein